MTGFPRPLEPPGEYPPSVAVAHASSWPMPLDDDALFGVEAAVAQLENQLNREQAPAVGTRLVPPFAPARDHVDGPISAPVTLVVFGAYGTPAARPLGRLLADVREYHPTTVRVAWRHFPDPPAHPRAAVFALAAEAAAARGKFWVLTRALLAMDHDDPRDLHHGLLRAGLDPERTLAEMRALPGAARIVEDTRSALASGVEATPALFIGRERYRGELTPAAVSAVIERARPA
jgi:protein-disulfide isomerase